jgi:hypothetical protein
MLTLYFLAVSGTELVRVVEANPGPGIPETSLYPSVRAPDIQVNASISWVNGELWATVNGEYRMATVHMFGDSYESGGTNFMVDYDMLEAHYPVPLNAQSISVKLDGTEANWSMPENSFSHLFGMDLPELNWMVSPVPRGLSITTSYEHAVPATPENDIVIWVSTRLWFV